jgi:carotenoid cleavage dioxygenase-like enzyme
MFDGSIDFPSWSDNDNSGSFYALTGAEATESGYFDSVARFDPTRGVQDRHHYGEGCMVEEHRFVPAPQAQRARQGWLIGTVLDYRRGRSGISILDAENLAAGPLAQAWLPGTVPLGFHGWFA